MPAESLSSEPLARNDSAALLRGMDFNMWEMFRETSRLTRGTEVREWTQYWMAAALRGTAFHNMIAICDAATDVDDMLTRAHAFYTRRGRPFSVWLRAHADAEIESTLLACGFANLNNLPAMALLRDPGTRCEPPELEIRAARTPAERTDFEHVTAESYATYGAPREYAADAFASLDSVCAPHIQGFVGYVAGEPVAAAAVYVTHGVAGIGWVGTVPQHRGHRYAEAVTWAAIREGLRRGATFANLQASPMGRPVYERMGFITLSEYRVLARPA